MADVTTPPIIGVAMRFMTSANRIELSRFLPMLHESIADHVCDCERSVLVTLLLDHVVQLPEEALLERDAESRNVFAVAIWIAVLEVTWLG